MRQRGFVLKSLAAKVSLSTMAGILVLLALALGGSMGDFSIMPLLLAVLATIISGAWLIMQRKPRLQPVRIRRKIR